MSAFKRIKGHWAGFPWSDNKGSKECRGPHKASGHHRLAVLAQLSAAKYDRSTHAGSRLIVGGALGPRVGILVWTKSWDKFVARNLRIFMYVNPFGGLAGGAQLQPDDRR